MEKNNGKIIAVVALIVAVVALSVGFAAFADQLTIDGNATVKQGANAFDDATNGLAYLSSSPSCVITGTQTSVATSPYSQGTATGDSWSGISVPLTHANPSVTCTATVENRTAYTAYLRGITSNTGVTCSSTGADAATNTSDVCGAITVDVTVGSVITDTIQITETAASKNDTTGSIAAMSENTPGTATVTVVIAYDNNVVPDGDVVVTLPTITHSYSSAQASS